MKKQQVILSIISVVVIGSLFLFGNTIPPKKDNPKPPMAANASKPEILFKDILEKAKKRLTEEQALRVTKIENSVTRGDVKDQQIKMYHQLATFWKDSLHLFEPYATYTAEAAKLESSEKNLTFAAHLFLDKLFIEDDGSMQHWLANNAKVLFEQALQLNPTNDSSKIGLGACYILGNVSDNPMQGILPVREIAQKNPSNFFAQYILGLGGKKSGQYDKAIERFSIINKANPENLEIVLHLAECYDLKGDRKNAIVWYNIVRGKINNPKAVKEITDRIDKLK